MGRIIELFFGLKGTVLPVIFERVVLVVVLVATWAIFLIHICCHGSMVFTAAIIVLEILVLPNQIRPDRYIFTFDHVNDDLTVLDQFKILAWLLLDKRLELAAFLE